MSENFQFMIIEKNDTMNIKNLIKEKLNLYLTDIDDTFLEYIMTLILNENTKLEFQEKMKILVKDNAKEFTDYVWEMLYDRAKKK